MWSAKRLNESELAYKEEANFDGVDAWPLTDDAKNASSSRKVRHSRKVPVLGSCSRRVHLTNSKQNPEFALEQRISRVRVYNGLLKALEYLTPSHDVVAATDILERNIDEQPRAGRNRPWTVLVRKSQQRFVGRVVHPRDVAVSRL